MATPPLDLWEGEREGGREGETERDSEREGGRGEGGREGGGREGGRENAAFPMAWLIRICYVARGNKARANHWSNGRCQKC